MSKWKKIKKSFLVNFGSLFGYLFLKSLYASQRWEYKFLDPKTKDIFQNSPMIMSFWHNQQLSMPKLFLGLKTSSTPVPYVMISKHTDGRLIAKTVSYFGINSVAGSSSDGGKEALISQINLLKNGNSAVITPDGPRGPIYKLKRGVLELAIATGAPIIPMAIKAKSYWEFKSWDRMILPKPFTKGTFLIGKPIYVTKKLDQNEFAEVLIEIENQMNDLIKLEM